MNVDWNHVRIHLQGECKECKLHEERERLERQQRATEGKKTDLDRLNEDVEQWMAEEKAGKID